MSIDRRIYSFQYRLISCYVLLLISLAVYAQSGKERFVGRVVDTETNQPVPFATVRLLALPDSILLVGGATDIQGKFQLAVTIPKSKSILLHISYIGYTSVYRTISVSANNKTPTLGNISLSPESISLNETVVVGQAPMAVTEGDTTVFNASAYRTPEGSMLEELVKQLPGGEIDEDGKLLIHGKEVKKILVDGKEFFSDDPKAALKNLPVEMIEKLKAYERQSDLARLTGIDDGEEEMILDLSVKKNMKRGWMENFMGGYGSKDRYELANTLNRFRDNSQLTVIGNLNNTNNQGFSEMQGESASSSGNLRTQKGLTTSRSLGVNATHDWKRVKFRSNIQYMGTDRLEDSRTTVDNYLRKDKSITESTGHNRQGNDNLVANAFLEWKMDSVTTLIFRPQYRTAANDRSSNGFQQGWGNDVLLNERTSRKKYNYNIGADFEPQKSVSRSLLEKATPAEEPLRKSVFNISPTVNFRYKFSKRTRLQIVYRGKSRQPNIRDLQPVTDRTNPLNIRVGNPSLKPSYTNTFTLNFNSYNAKHQRNMVASVLAENTINSITNQVTYDSESGVRTTTPLNLNGNWRAMGSFSLNTPFKNRSWRFRTYSYLQYRNQNGYSTINKEAPVKSTVKHLTARQRLQLTYRTKQMEISARAELLYNNSHNNVKETRTETYDYRFGTEVQYYFPWGIELFSDLTCFQRSGYGYSGNARENLMWNCQLSKAFLKRKQLLLRFKIYDILHQDVSMIRTITATAIRDTDYNALGSYFMVHAILRLNMMGR